MSDVVEHSLQYLSDDDITAIARYLKSLPPRGGKQTPAPVEDSVAKDLWKGNDSKTGAALYVDNCAACHRTDGVGYKRAFPSLKGIIRWRHAGDLNERVWREELQPLWDQYNRRAG